MKAKLREHFNGNVLYDDGDAYKMKAEGLAKLTLLNPPWD